MSSSVQSSSVALTEPPTCAQISPQIVSLRSVLLSGLDTMQQFKIASRRKILEKHMKHTQERIIQCKQSYDEKTRELVHGTDQTAKSVNTLKTKIEGIQLHYNDLLDRHEDLNKQLNSINPPIVTVDDNEFQIATEKVQSSLMVLINQTLRRMERGLYEFWKFNSHCNVMTRHNVDVYAWSADRTTIFVKTCQFVDEIELLNVNLHKFKSITWFPVVLNGFTKDETISIYDSLFKVMYDTPVCFADESDLSEPEIVYKIETTQKCSDNYE